MSQGQNAPVCRGTIVFVCTKAADKDGPPAWEQIPEESPGCTGSCPRGNCLSPSPSELINDKRLGEIYADILTQEAVDQLNDPPLGMKFSVGCRCQ